MELWKRAIEMADAGTELALATVTRASGSTPRHQGAKMLVAADGSIFGTIGGGRVELELITRGCEVAVSGNATVINYNLVQDLGMSCGGAMEIYVEPFAPSREVVVTLVDLLRRRRPVLLTTPLDGSPKSVVPLLPGGVTERREGVFIEAIHPVDRVIIFGGGHVGQAIGPAAAAVGFEPYLCDDTRRPAAWARRLIDSFDLGQVAQQLGGLGEGDYAIIVTRDHRTDLAVLEQLLPNLSLSYLGMIGSTRKVAQFRHDLEARGIATHERWSRLRAPIGIDIGAESPAEIAVAVVAQLISVRRGVG